MPPILPLADEDIKRFAKGIPRSKMGSFMRRFPLSQKARLGKYLKEIYQPNGRRLMSRLLTHRISAVRIVEDIWAKWDFDRNDTLPAKTIRLGPEHNRFRNTGTGQAYIAI